MGIKESAREIAKKISEGKLAPEHLGKYSVEMIDQEIFSLGNTKPAFRDQKWIKKFTTIHEEIMNKLSRNERSIYCQIQLKDLERVSNQRWITKVG